MVSGVEALASSPLMNGMGEDELGVLLRTAEERTYNVGKCIIEEGKPSDCFYMLVAGGFVVAKGPGDDQVMINTLDQCGDFFGEMSLIDILLHCAGFHNSQTGFDDVLSPHAPDPDDASSQDRSQFVTPFA